jgi:hypothetical protein
MPRSSQIAETPQPVPISTTLRASIAPASSRRMAPAPGVIGVAPSSEPRWAAAATTSSGAMKFSA